MSIESPPLERKLVAILAADVAGYSRLMHLDEEGTLATLTGHRSVIDRLIAAGSGNITSTAGDSVLAEFASVVEAVACAVEIQRCLADENALLPDDRQMRFRIGINVGDVMVKDGGIFGDGVNVAARVEGLAPPGGICITRGVRDHVRDRLSYRFADLGDHSVKNIDRPVHVYRVLLDADEIQAADRARPDSVSLAAPEAPALSTSPSVDEIELAYWKSVETGANAEEYRAYLNRFPDGTFAALASARLSAPPAPTPEDPQAHAVEILFWESIKDGGDPALFQAYLDNYPEGAFRAIAEIKAASGF